MPVPWNSKSPVSKRFPGGSPHNQFSGSTGASLQYPPRNSRERLISTVSELHYGLGGSLSAAKQPYSGDRRYLSETASETAERSPFNESATLNQPWFSATYHSPWKWLSSWRALLVTTSVIIILVAWHLRRPKQLETLEDTTEPSSTHTITSFSSIQPETGSGRTAPLSDLPLEYAAKLSRAYNELGAKLQQITSHSIETQKLESKQRQRINSHLNRLDSELTQLKSYQTGEASKLDTALRLHQRNFDQLHDVLTEMDAKIKSLAATSLAPAPKKDQDQDEMRSRSSEYLETFEEFREEVSNKLRQLELSLYQDDATSIDWARASLGARIEMAHTSPALGARSGLVKILEWGQRWYKLPESFPPEGRNPDVVIGGNSDNRTPAGIRPLPGNCFSFKGSNGNVTIILPTAVSIRSVRMDHVAPSINPNWAAAPKSVVVFVDQPDRVSEAPFDDAVNEAGGEALGDAASEVPLSQAARFLYPRFAPATRVAEFDLNYPTSTSAVVPVECPEGSECKSRRIRFQIQSNYGGGYTCIYRFRVFGTVESTETLEGTTAEDSTDEGDLSPKQNVL